jgi:hypothetical protein
MTTHPTTDPEAILEAATNFYLKSHDFNGMPIRDVLGSGSEILTALEHLILDGRISVVFGDRHPNPHIQAFDPDPTDEQIEKLHGDLTHACVYPTRKHLSLLVNTQEYAGKPYALALALGEPQLSCRFFELKVLDYYRNDPRFGYQTDDIQGSIGILDAFDGSAEVMDRDKVLLQQFGFGYDRGITTRVVAVLLWDLFKLSPEHQQIWAANEVSGDYLPHPDFWGSVCGHWPEKVSIFQAFIEELQEINEMSVLMGRKPLFRQDFKDGRRPPEFGFLIRPTLAEFNSFALLLDKLMSDNINLDFFGDEVSRETLEERPDGVKVAKPKGSITILSEWLEKVVRLKDSEPKDKMLATFRKVRKLRQKPAHAVAENVFDQQYFRDQRQLIIDAYAAVRTIRLLFANHPGTQEHKVREWLYNGDIWTR